MDHEQGRDGFRVEFEAEPEYHLGPRDGAKTSAGAKEPGYLEANATGVRQHFDTPSTKFGGEPTFDKRALFHVALTDVSSLRWNEATGDVQLNTREKQGMRAPRPMYFSERDVAVDTAERLASLWFPGAVRERTVMTNREQQLHGGVSRAIGAAFMLAPLAAFVALIVMGWPLVIALVTGFVLSFLALAGRSVLKINKADRDGVAELVASGKGWVEVVNPELLIG